MTQYSLTVEHPFAIGLIGQIGYLGSRGANLPYYGDPNSIPAEVLPDGRKRVVPGATLRYPSWGRILTRSTGATSAYNGLVVGLSKRLGADAHMQASYTFAKSEDDWSGGQVGSSEYSNSAGSVTDWWDLRAERAPSNFDVRHNFVANVIYRLPSPPSLNGVAGGLVQGWQLAAIATVSSGVPFTPYIGFDRAGDGHSDTDLQKPDWAPSATRSPTVGDVDNWYDVTDFVLPPAGYYGNFGRLIWRSPRTCHCDAGALKSVWRCSTHSIGPISRHPTPVSFYSILTARGYRGPAV